MRIAVIGDPHLENLYDSKNLVSQMMHSIAEFDVQATLCLGDITSGEYTNPQSFGQDILLNDKSLLYVTGNHDLWSVLGRPRQPDWTLQNIVKEYSKNGLAAQSLEHSMSDNNTVIEIGDVAFVGTMGFPDFKHPKFVMPPEYYNSHSCTNDSTYINLSSGWKYYTDKMLKAFRSRLAKAVSGMCKTVVVSTHYPVFEEQYRMSGDDISAYFFCHTIGQMVKEVAQEHPDKKFWVFSAHAHDYCRGALTLAAENVATCGIMADYRWLNFSIFDLDEKAGFNNQTVVKKQFPERCKIVVETVVSGENTKHDSNF